MSTLLNAFDAAITKATGLNSKESTIVKEVSKDEPSNKDIEQYVAMALNCGRKVAEIKNLRDQSNKLMSEVNKAIVALKLAEVSVGRQGKCSIATAFMDGLMDGGIAKTTAQNYLSVFRKAVSEGQAITEWNPSRNKESNDVVTSNDKAVKKGAQHRAAPEFSTILKKAYAFEDGEAFKALCFEIEGLYEDAKIDSFYAGFVSFLEKQGEVKN